MHLSYPVFIKPDGNYHLAYIPDWGIFTEGFGFKDAIIMACDAIELALSDAITIPCPSDERTAKENTMVMADEEDFKYSDGMLVYVVIERKEPEIDVS